MRPFAEQLPILYTPDTPGRGTTAGIDGDGRPGGAGQDFTLKQLFPSTASGWGLELWERAWGIPVDRTLSDQRRRDRILAKIKGTGTTTVEVIRAVAQSFSSFPAEVIEESALCRFVIWYLGTIGEIEHKEDLIAAVNELKPARMDWEIRYRQTLDSSVYLGAFPRQGDAKILWEVDCT